MAKKGLCVKLSDAEISALESRYGTAMAGVRHGIALALAGPGVEPAPDNPAGGPNRSAPTRQQGRKAKAVATAATDGATAVAEPAAEPPTWRFRSRWCRPCLDAKQPLCRACRHLEQMR